MKLVGDNLTCERATRTVFTGLSFAVAAGRGLILRGPNGSGKSTLLRLIAGFLSASEGRIALQGGDEELTVGQQTLFVGHTDAVKTGFTVRENLEFWTAYYGGGDVWQALEAFALTDLCEIPAGFLSAGQKRRLGLSRLALVDRPLWLLDEPTVSLDRDSQERLATLMDGHVAAGGIVIAATHMPLGVAFKETLELGCARVAA